MEDCRMRLKSVSLLVLPGLIAFHGSTLTAQSMAERMKQKAKEAAEKVQRKAEDKADQAVDKAIDKLEECLFSDTECIKKAAAKGKKVAYRDEDGNAVDAKGKPLPKTKAVADADAREATTSAAKQADALSAADNTVVQTPPGQGAWANYDFVPGNRVLFADDFAADRIGNFPRRLELGAGSMELVEWQGQRLIRSNDNGFLVINLREALPQKFTFEVDVVPGNGTGFGEPVIAFAGPASVSVSGDLTMHADEKNLSYVAFGEREVGLRRQGVNNTVNLNEEMAGKLFHLRLMADGNYVKVFVNEKRVANVPNANLGRSNKIYIGLNAENETPAFIGNIKVAAGGRDLYDALAADGRIAVQGIYFDTGSDRLRPESSGTLKQIADMLTAHSDLKLTIEGHTDNVGTATSNRTLSEKRAAAVKAALTSQYGIDTSRLGSAGFGDSKPAAPNTTPEGRQQNRRVELVKM